MFLLIFTLMNFSLYIKFSHLGSFVSLNNLLLLILFFIENLLDIAEMVHKNPIFLPELVKILIEPIKFRILSGGDSLYQFDNAFILGTNILPQQFIFSDKDLRQPSFFSKLKKPPLNLLLKIPIGPLQSFNNFRQLNITISNDGFFLITFICAIQSKLGIEISNKILFS